MKCEDCKFWVKLIRKGKCYRFPPVPIIADGTGLVSVLPDTSPDDFCGEFKHKETEPD